MAGQKSWCRVREKRGGGERANPTVQAEHRAEGLAAVEPHLEAQHCQASDAGAGLPNPHTYSWLVSQIYI